MQNADYTMIPTKDQSEKYMKHDPITQQVMEVSLNTPYSLD